MFWKRNIFFFILSGLRGQLINQNRDPRENPRKILIDKAINLMSQNAPIPTTRTS